MEPLSRHILDRNFNISGTNLIEASAGTGKTYSIQTLFLRLVVVEEFPVQDLLIVTFTDAATKELRERLHAILDKCLLYADKKLTSEDADYDRIKGVIDLTMNTEEKNFKRRIKRALLDFDQAAIYTIHGFCQQTLTEYAFECGFDFDTEVNNSDAPIRLLCTDWWRQVKYNENNDLLSKILKNRIPEPDKLLNLAKEIIKRPMAKILPDDGGDNLSFEQTTSDAVKYLRDNKDKVTDDLNRDHTSNFIPQETKDEIENSINILCNPPATDNYTLFQELTKLIDLLAPKKITNLYNPPLKVQECINAYDKCNVIIKNKGVKIQKGEFVPTAEYKEEWENAFKNTKTLIDKNYDAFEKFTKEIKFFYTGQNKAFADESYRTDKLEALKNQTPATTYKTAVNKICSLKKYETVTWIPLPETAGFKDTLALLKKEAKKQVLTEQAKGLKEVIEKYTAAKREACEMTYDDMLQLLNNALTGDKSNRLIEALKKKYRAALIDEFQDTDPIQYNIFNAIFGESKSPLFYVGDPKQSVYSFRGGDIFTYTKAVNSVNDENRYSLDTNYRSQAPLINAINNIFMDREQKSVFDTEQINYAEKLKCNDLNTRIFDNGKLDQSPFIIWNYKKNESDKKTSSYSSNEAHIIYQEVAKEVIRLLNGKNTGFVKQCSEQGTSKNNIKRVQPSDIAILVKRHGEAAHIYRYLTEKGVPAVRQAGNNVFDSSEATELFYILKAMVNPENISTIQTALASKLIPISDDNLINLNNSEPLTSNTIANLEIKALPNSLEQWIHLFKETKELWLRKNFSTAFSHFTKKTGIYVNLASQQLAERHITNLKQLNDLIHQVSIERHLGKESIIKWFSKQLEKDTREENDAFETRLESDSNAVHIMTIFKSKGLEFPIVFAPTLWTNRVGKKLEVCRVYHNQEDNENEAIIHLDMGDPPKKDTAQKNADKEKTEEEIRNIYVAVTRASHRVYMVAGELGSNNNALSKVAPSELIEQWDQDETSGISVINKNFSEFPSSGKYQTSNTTDINELEVKTARIDTSRSHASFSSITPQGHITPSPISDLRDFDANTTTPDIDVEQTDKELNIFTFPAGAKTGECWHSIFELLDFQADDSTIKNVVEKQLKLFQLDTGNNDTVIEKRTIIINMVKAVLSAKMKASNNNIVTLNEISKKQKLAEMAFDFSLETAIQNQNNQNSILTVLNDEWKDAAEGSEEKIFLQRLKGWKTKIPNGFMTGFIDLLFEHNGKYYILDWKSNRINCTPESFDRNGLVAEIATHSYFLQYLIYTVAVHLYLSQSLKDYNYDNHFGGILYIFLRGIDQATINDNQNGIFYTMPKKKLIENLSYALMGDAGGN